MTTTDALRLTLDPATTPKAGRFGATTETPSNLETDPPTTRPVATPFREGPPGLEF
jgi:hypothetical protein